jgi:hypothetical protein
MVRAAAFIPAREGGGESVGGREEQVVKVRSCVDIFLFYQATQAVADAIYIRSSKTRGHLPLKIWMQTLANH